MCPDTNFQEKMDVLDLIINVLKDHDQNLVNLADKFESVLNNLYSVESRVSSLNETFAQTLFSKTSGPNDVKKPIAFVQCIEWKEFKSRSADASMVAFEVDEKAFTVNSLSGDVLYKYSESLPEVKFQVEEGENRYVVKKMAFSSEGGLFPVFDKQLKCGLEVFTEGQKFDLSEDERFIQLRYCVDHSKARKWVSRELNIPEEKVIEGKLAYSL